MAILQNRVSQLSTIIQAWNEIEESSQNKSINFISEFIESASLLQKLSGDEDLGRELKTFNENYQKLFDKDLSKLGASDLSSENVKILNQIKEIDNGQKELATKRDDVIALLEQEGFTLKSFRKILIEESDDKYPHAHVKVSWNYGNFIEHIGENLSSEKKEEFYKLKAELSKTENDEEFYEKLVLLNQSADIAANFDKLKKRFEVDGIEEHTLINQGTQYRAKLDVIELIAEIHQESADNLLQKSKEFFQEKGELKSIKIDTEEIWKNFQANLPLEKKAETPIPAGIEKPQFTLGFEVESIILPTKGPNAEAQRKEQFSEFEKIKRGCADHNSRREMRHNYGLDSSVIGSSPNALLLFSADELTRFKAQNHEKYGNKISAIKEHVQEYVQEYVQREQKNYQQEISKFDEVLGNLALLSQEEILFFDLFYLRKNKAIERRLAMDDLFDWRDFTREDKAIEHRLAMDDLFDWRDKEKKHQEKFLKILEDIGERGSFYSKTLDMIRATEFAIGEFPIETSQQEFDASLIYVRKVAKEHGLRLKDRSIQINVGAELGQKRLSISSENSGEDLEIFTDPLTIAVGLAIQKALAKTFEECPFLKRKGQDIIGIEVNVDRKKGLSKTTRGTKFFISFDSQKSPEANMGLTSASSAFRIHRLNTGKSGTIRLARLGDDNEEAVFELRLLVNNPHAAYFDGRPRKIFNGAELAAKILQKNLEEEFKSLEIKGGEKKIIISEDGKIDEIPVIKKASPASSSIGDANAKPVAPKLIKRKYSELS
jgi:hypothetical protein